MLPLDLSAGMRPEVVGDIQALPLADDSVNGALAMHMLYHVPDVPAAVRDLRRVLRPGGVLMVSTNGVDDKREVTKLFVGALADLTGKRIAFPDFDGGFTIEGADLLRPSSPRSRSRCSSGRRSFLVEPVVAFLDSMRGLSAGLLKADVEWAAFLGRCPGTRVADEIDRHGVWRMGNQVGVLTCR